jgi:Flp pilus assembly protein TadD
MRNQGIHRGAGLAAGGRSARLLGWHPAESEPTDLILARQAIDRRQFADAERHLRRALDAAPRCAGVRTLMGSLHERLGEHHAAYQCYRLALTLDPRDADATSGLLRYCQRFGYDSRNRTINPAGTRSNPPS